KTPDNLHGNRIDIVLLRNVADDPMRAQLPRHSLDTFVPARDERDPGAAAKQFPHQGQSQARGAARDCDPQVGEGSGCVDLTIVLHVWSPSAKPLDFLKCYLYLLRS